MSWEVQTGHDANGHVTLHHRGGSVALHVEHISDPVGQGFSEPITHHVRLSAAPHEALMTWPTRKHGAEQAYLGRGHYGPPPSERLRALIESHGKDHAWMPLLDALAEEYPEHFERPVAEHTRQRASIS